MCRSSKSTQPAAHRRVLGERAPLSGLLLTKACHIARTKLIFFPTAHRRVLGERAPVSGLLLEHTDGCFQISISGALCRWRGGAVPAVEALLLVYAGSI